MMMMMIERRCKI